MEDPLQFTEIMKFPMDHNEYKFKVLDQAILHPIDSTNLRKWISQIDKANSWFEALFTPKNQN